MRADHAGTQGEYVVSEVDFDELIRDGESDGELVAYFDSHVDDAHREAANLFVLDEMKSHVDEQDAEEGRAA